MDMPDLNEVRADADADADADAATATATAAAAAAAAAAAIDDKAGRPPLLLIRMHPADNVAIVANDGGLPAGTLLPDGLALREKVPQGHKVALIDLPAGATVRRYNVPIGTTLAPIPAGSWVHERRLAMPAAGALHGLPMATTAAPVPALRNISLNPNFGGELMVVSLGCEKLQPERLLPPGSFAIVDERGDEAGPETVCLQDDRHVDTAAARLTAWPNVRSSRSRPAATWRGAGLI
jgi:hypothetical protein